MFRSLSERRDWAMLQRLATLSGSGGIVFAGSLTDPDADLRLPESATEAHHAMALGEVGNLALTLIIETAAAMHGRDERRMVWKRMKPDAGAHASVFLTRGLASTTEVV